MLTGKPSLIRWLIRVLLLAWALALAACASTSPGQPKLVDHQFSFDGWSDKWTDKVDLLAYSYGDKYRMVRDTVTGVNGGGWVSDHAVTYTDRVPARTNIHGPMPVGEFLYVKWRIKATGEVLEDRVDLRPLLPKNMTDYGLTFVPDANDRQLYVYLVTPTPSNFSEHPPLKTTQSRYNVTYEIYPHNTFSSSQR